MSEDTNLKNLVSSLTKFLEWQDEYQLVMAYTKEGDAAHRLMDVLGVPSDQVSVLIGGSNCPIFDRAATEIKNLTARIEELSGDNRALRAENKYLKSKPGVR